MKRLDESLLIGGNVQKSNKDILIFSAMPSNFFKENPNIPSMFDTFRKLLGNTFNIVHLEENVPSIEDIKEDHIIITGSPYNIDEDLPWLRKTEELIRQCSKTRKKVLGICLGQHLIATAFGGKVEKMPDGRKVGFLTSKITEDGKSDPLLAGLGDSLTIAQTHKYAITKLPENAKVLVSNGSTAPHQIIRVGENIYGIQGHPEMTPEELYTLCSSRKEDIVREVFNGDLEEFNKFLIGVAVANVQQGTQVINNFVNS